jgi:hypothetical protein
MRSSIICTFEQNGQIKNPGGAGDKSKNRTVFGKLYGKKPHGRSRHDGEILKFILVEQDMTLWNQWRATMIFRIP